MTKIRKIKKLVAALLCVTVVITLFSGCRKDTGASGNVIFFDIPKAVTNLDPQFATDASARMIIANIYEGLLTRDKDGELTEGVAESYSLSGDGLVYTFKLRENAIWANGKAVTADDFVFAFRRMFTPGQTSPFAADYAVIENADKIISGESDLSSLGVTAKGEKELEIRLSHKSPHFPALFAETPAMPCDKEFFDESRGRYGLEKSLVNANGPFYLDKWDNETLITNLRPNSKYSPSLPSSLDGVNIRVAESAEAYGRLLERTCDLAMLPVEDAEKLKNEGFAVTEFENKVWCVVFNPGSQVWGNPLLRQGLSLATVQESLRGKMPPQFSPASFLIPPESALANKPYRDFADAAPVEFDEEQGLRLFQMGAQALGMDGPLSATMYVPDKNEHLLAVGVLQQDWQKHLSAYISVEAASEEDIVRRFQTGDYDMLLLPLSAVTPRAEDILSMFASDSPLNHFGYRNPLYDGFFRSIAEAENLDQAFSACARAESLLLQDAVLIPVYVEKTAFAAGQEFRKIRPTPYPSRLYFKFAK